MDIEKLFEGEESFIKIAKHYYNKNFGTMSKSDFELLMFTILYDKLKEADDKKHDEKGTSVTAINLALDLGITVTKVDNLIEKMMLKKTDDELSEIPWKQTLSKLLESRTVTFDASENSYCLIIDDVYVLYKAMDVLRTNDLYFQKLPNPRGLILSQGALVALAYECCEKEKKSCFESVIASYLPNKNIQEMIKEKTIWTEIGKFTEDVFFDSIGRLLSDAASNSLRKIYKEGLNKLKAMTAKKKS